MSEENHEQRIAEMESKVGDLIKLSTGLARNFNLVTVALAKSGDFTKLATTKIMQTILAAQGINDNVFRMLAHSLPEHIQPEFKKILDNALFHRDQLAAAIEAFNQMPPPSSGLPPDSLPPPPPPPGP